MRRTSFLLGALTVYLSAIVLGVVGVVGAMALSSLGILPRESPAYPFGLIIGSNPGFMCAMAMYWRIKEYRE